jgi:integrase/recombinase XerD
MGVLRTRMIEEMKLRNFSPRTQQSYLAAVIGLVKHYRRSPDELTQDEVRSYLLHLEKRGLSPSSRNVAISGMKFTTRCWAVTTSSCLFRRESEVGCYRKC